jgi:UDP-glucose 4-epimerase
MRTLVTGSSGFLGSHLVDELLRRSHEVIAFDLQAAPWPTSAHQAVGDVRDTEELTAAMEGIEAVFHCAAVADLDDARTDPRRAVDINVLGTLAVLEAARRVGASRFMLASSVYVYSQGGSVYRTTKQAAEGLVEDLSREWGLRSTILRFGSLYGPHADANNAIARLTRQAVLDGRIDFWGDGTEVREYIHIQDAAALAVDALDPLYTDQSLHITGNERMTTRELLETINEIMGGGLQITLRDEPFTGRYRLTPYAYREGVGRKMVGSTYVDLGVGLLEAIRQARAEEGGAAP